MREGVATGNSLLEFFCRLTGKRVLTLISRRTGNDAPKYVGIPNSWSMTVGVPNSPSSTSSRPISRLSTSSRPTSYCSAASGSASVMLSSNETLPVGYAIKQAELYLVSRFLNSQRRPDLIPQRGSERWWFPNNSGYAWQYTAKTVKYPKPYGGGARCFQVSACPDTVFEHDERGLIRFSVFRTCCPDTVAIIRYQWADIAFQKLLMRNTMKRSRSGKSRTQSLDSAAAVLAAVPHNE